MKTAKSFNRKTAIMILFAISLLKEYFLDGGLVFIPSTDAIRILSRIIDLIIYSGGLVYVLTEKYNKKEKIILILGSILILIVSLRSGELGLVPFWMWIILVKQVEYDKWIKISLCCNCIGLLTGVAATLVGIYQEEETIYRSVLGIRYTFGLQQPNLTGNIFFLVAASYGWLKKEKLKKSDYVILIVITAIVFVFMNSLGSTIVLVVYIITVFLFQNIIKSEEARKKGSFVLFLMAMGFAVLSIILGVINVAEIPVLAQLDKAMSYRYTDVFRTFSARGFSLLGQKFNFEELDAYARFSGERKYYMDCMWMSLPVHYGIVFSSIFVYIYFSAMFRFVQKAETMTVIIFFCGALYAMEQRIWPFLFIWIFMVFVAEKLFQRKYF